jgi:hypothetical protein
MPSTGPKHWPKSQEQVPHLQASDYFCHNKNSQLTHLTSWGIPYSQQKRLVTAENSSQMGLLTMFVKTKNKLQYICPTWNALKDHAKGKSFNEYTYICLMGTGKWSLTRQSVWIDQGVYINWKHFWMLIPDRKHILQSSHWTAMYAGRIGPLLAIVLWWAHEQSCCVAAAQGLLCKQQGSLSSRHMWPWPLLNYRTASRKKSCQLPKWYIVLRSTGHLVISWFHVSFCILRVVGIQNGGKESVKLYILAFLVGISSYCQAQVQLLLVK